MKARRLKMRKDVWTRTLFSGSQWGVYMGRQVMYYLESDLPLCLIRAWLREAVTAGFSPCVRMSAQEWRWTCDHRGELDQYSHTLNVKCRKCITLCCHVHWRVVSSEYLGNITHYFIGQLWGDSSHWGLKLITVMCQDHRELCFIQSLIEVETPSSVLRHCSASKP